VIERGIDSSSVAARRQGLVFTRVDEDLLGLDSEQGLVHSLNATAARVWEIVEQPTTVATICDTLEREYDVDPTVCATQVTVLLEGLRRAGLVTVEPGTGERNTDPRA
jgi:PqqD family protein of HPr-rel-A system